MRDPGRNDQFFQLGPFTSVARPSGLSRVAIPAVVACAGLVLLGLYWTFSGRPAAVEPRTVDTEASPVAEKAGEDVALRDRVVDAGTARVPARSADTSSHAIPKEPERDAGYPAPPDAQSDEFTDDGADGQLTISGWVLDEDGGAVSSIRVFATPRLLRPAPEQNMTAAGGRRERSVETDAYGFFEFRGLADGIYEIGNRSTERYAAATTVVAAGVDAVVLVVKDKDERLRRVHVHGVVESPDGERLAQVRVLPVGQKSSATTDAAGSYEFHLAVRERRQSQAIKFMREGYRDRHITLSDTDLDGIDSIPLDVVMEPIMAEAPVTGAVTGTDGEAIAGATIRLDSVRLGRGYQVGSDLAGTFSIPRVELATDYRLWVRPKEHYEDYIEGGLMVPAGGLDLEVFLDPQDLGSLNGRMVDPDGNPLPEISLWLRSAQATDPPTLLVSGDGHGRFFVEDLPAGKLSLDTRSFPRFSISGIEIVAGAERQVELTLDSGDHEIAGHVRNAQGDPVAMSQVSLTWSRYDNGVSSNAIRSTTTDDNGYFLVTQLGRDQHRLTVVAPGYRTAQLDVEPTGNGRTVVVQLEEVRP